jgi:hypothetical protein
MGLGMRRTIGASGPETQSRADPARDTGGLAPIKLVSLARPEDGDELYGLLTGENSLASNNNTFGFQLSETRIREHIRLGTERKGGLHGVIRADGVIVASIGSLFDRFWFSDEYGISVLWLFVRPGHRRHRYDQALVGWIKHMRDEIAAGSGRKIPIVDAVISEVRLETKLRLWRRHGGRLIGGIYLIG